MLGANVHVAAADDGSAVLAWRERTPAGLRLRVRVRRGDAPLRPVRTVPGDAAGLNEVVVAAGPGGRGLVGESHFEDVYGIAAQDRHPTSGQVRAVSPAGLGPALRVGATAVLGVAIAQDGTGVVGLQHGHAADVTGPDVLRGAVLPAGSRRIGPLRVLDRTAHDSQYPPDVPNLFVAASDDDVAVGWQNSDVPRRGAGSITFADGERLQHLTRVPLRTGVYPVFALGPHGAVGIATLLDQTSLFTAFVRPAGAHRFQTVAVPQPPKPAVTDLQQATFTPDGTLLVTAGASDKESGSEVGGPDDEDPTARTLVTRITP